MTFREAMAIALVLTVTVPFSKAEYNDDSENNRTGWTPFQFAVWHPIQLFNEDTDVYGARTSLFYGKNRDVYGLDLSLFANKARNVYGVSILVFGNELYHGFLPFDNWHHDATDTGNVTGIQIGGGLGGAIGILMPYPIIYYAGLTTHARDMTGLQLSLFGSRARRLKGLQVAGLITVADEQANGMQFSLLSNKAGGDGACWQIALGLNETGEEYRGMKLALMANYADGDYSGIQMFPLVGNIVRGKSTGIHLSMLHNRSESFRGLQLSGLFNYTGNPYGPEKDSAGMQIGAFNVANGNMTGMQVGAFNYCKQMTGIQVGALNIIREGQIPVLLGINASF
ncbi:MAG: LA_2272 family surface repeat-containing protein [Verrucomicrobiota bacterium]